MTKIYSLIIISFLIKSIQTTIEMSINVTTEQSADINWRTAFEEDIIGYNMTISPLSVQDKTRVIAMEIDSNYSLPVRVGGLTPGAEYSVRLDAISLNKTLVSIKRFTTKPNPPDNSLFCHYSVQSIHVMWESPKMPTIFDVYRASIEPEDSPSSIQFVEKDKQSTVFEGLTPGRAYILTVQTDSKNILSNPLKLLCRTTPAAPSYLWYDPNELSSYSFDIQWGAPKIASEFDSYLLLKDDNLYKKIPENEPRFAHFSQDLKPGKTYKIEVNTRSEIISSKSISLNITTRPLPVLSLKAKPGNTSDIFVEWTVNPNSTQDSFMVTFWEINAFVYKESVRVINKTSIQLYNLLSDRNYSIAVVAVSNNISSIPPMIIYQYTRPAAPQIIKLERTSDRFINISWKAVQDRAEAGYYKIMYTRTDTNETKINIVKDYWALLFLYPGAKYEINVTTYHNGQRSLASTHTHLMPPKPPHNIRLTNFTSSSISLSWSQPNDSLVEYYILRYRPYSGGVWHGLDQEFRPINGTTFEITDLTIGEKYSIKVTSFSNGIESSEKKEIDLTLDPNSLSTKQIDYDDDVDGSEEVSSQRNTVLAILICLLIMTLCIVGPGVYMYYIRGKWAIDQEEEKGKPEGEPLKPEKEDHDKLDDAILINRDEIQIMQQIGQGQFGYVHFGSLTVRKGRLSIPVAIKMSNVIDKDRDMTEFLKEAFIMKNFSHENVLTLIGVSFESDGSPLVVLPFMKNGDLLSYIRSENNEPTVRQLLRFAIDVSKGMEYLSNQHFIHRDLAARNCMLDNDLCVKVADFGLSKHIISKDYYKTENSMQVMPIKWMSIESLEKGIYDTKTDVWSYGVLVWELMTRGIVPYPNLQHFEVLLHLRNGYRLPQPNYCPDLVFEMMLKCWSLNPKKRPTFTDISNRLEEIIDTIEKANFSEHVQIDNITYYNHHPITYSLTIN